MLLNSDINNAVDIRPGLCTFWDNVLHRVRFKIFNITIHWERDTITPDLFLSQPEREYFPDVQLELQSYCAALLSNDYENRLEKNLGETLGIMSEEQHLITFEEFKNLFLLDKLAE